MTSVSLHASLFRKNPIALLISHPITSRGRSGNVKPNPKAQDFERCAFQTFEKSAKGLKSRAEEQLPTRSLEMKLSISILIALLASYSHAFSVEQVAGKSTRREIFQGFAGIAAATILSSALPTPALASGGATAGKYT